MVAGVDDEDVALLDLDLAEDHFRSVDAVIRHEVGNVSHHARTGKVGEGDVSDGTTAGMEGAFANKVGTNSIAPVQDLPVSALSAAVSAGNTFEEMHFQ